MIKCSFKESKISYLGFVSNEEGIKSDPAEIFNTIQVWSSALTLPSKA